MAATVSPYPHSWSKSFAHWWNTSTTSSASAEEALLRRGLEPSIPLYIAPSSPIAANASEAQSDRKAGSSGKLAISRSVQLDDRHKHQRLNLVEIGTPERDAKEHPVIVLHGYGGGLAYYWQNLHAMAAQDDVRLYLVDWLGMGRSGRPSFPRIKAKGDPRTPANVRSRVQQAEEFFVESLEMLRQKEKIEKFTLVGHSLGGYMSIAYALKYPEKVSKLVLVSPVGIPESPYESDPYDDPAPSQANLERITQAEFKQSQIDMQRGSQPDEAEAKKLPRPNAWWAWLWERNVSPFQIVRLSTFLGPALVSRYATRRYAAFDTPVQRELYAYLYEICREKGSGEYALAHILSPGAYARWPMVKRVNSLNMPMTFIYGEHDWMDPKGGEDILAAIRAKPDSAAVKLQKLRSKQKINQHSGHWVFLDNPKGFDKILAAELREAVQDAKL